MEREKNLSNGAKLPLNDTHTHTNDEIFQRDVLKLLENSALLVCTKFIQQFIKTIFKQFRYLINVSIRVSRIKTNFPNLGTHLIKISKLSVLLSETTLNKICHLKTV